MALPKPNEFIPTDFTIHPCDEPTEYPRLIRETPLLKLYHKQVMFFSIRLIFLQDTTFLVPKLNVYINFVTPELNRSPKAVVLGAIYQHLLEEELNAYSYYADITGLSFCVSSGIRKLSVRLFD